MVPKLTTEEWKEVYYAIHARMNAPGVFTDKEWTQELRRIIRKIQPLMDKERAS